MDALNNVNAGMVDRAFSNYNTGNTKYLQTVIQSGQWRNRIEACVKEAKETQPGPNETAEQHLARIALLQGIQIGTHLLQAATEKQAA